MEQSKIKKVIKRDGREVSFNRDNVFSAIWKAVQSVGGTDRERAEFLTNETVRSLNEKFEAAHPSVEDIQDTVESSLIKNGHAKTAKAFILYRQKRKEFRDLQKAILGAPTKSNLSLNALKLMKEHLLIMDETGVLKELPEDLFRRVAKNVANVDKKYDSPDTAALQEEFYNVMTALDFLPTSNVLMNSGTKLQQLAPSYVIPIEDSLDSIFDAVALAASCQQAGAGTGFNFSSLRPNNEWLSTVRGYSRGPVSFLHIFDATTETIKKGGRKRGANMAILSVNHPDIQEFITVKDKTRTLKNFNLSVGITDHFMENFRRERKHKLVNPKSNEAGKEVNAKDIMDLITFYAWRSGEPGVVFLDKIAKSNPVPEIPLNSTDSCAALLLNPYETCMIGSINVANFFSSGEVDYARLGTVVATAVHFLDNTIDASNYPSKKCETITLANRKIGLGIMGFADLLYQLEIPYDSEEAVALAKKLMKFIHEQSAEASMAFAKKRGAFPHFNKSIYHTQGIKLRNATLTALPPTGTISIIADVSSSIEPNFSVAYTRKVLEGKEFTYINKYFAQKARENGFYSEDMIQEIVNKPSISGVESIPRKFRKIFVTAHDIAPEWHIKIQAAFQDHTDHAISKTINFPHNATITAIQDAYNEAHRLGCKGLTVYRDGSLEEQVITFKDV